MISNNKVNPEHVKSADTADIQENELRATKESLESSEVEVTDSTKVNFNEEGRYRPKVFSAWAMGMATVLGGTYYGWNEGLKIGFGGYLVAQVLMGLAYIVLVFGLAEIVSSVSFSGGAYGMARVMSGFYVGFLVASFELTEYIAYTAFSYQFVAEFLCEKMSWGEVYKPVVALVCYVISALFVLESNHVYWTFSNLLGVFCVVGLLIYILGSLPYTNISANASLQVDVENGSSMSNWFQGGMSEYMTILPLTTWGFGGIESGALVTDLIYKPRKNLSRGISLSVLTLFALMMLTMFVCVSLSPGLQSAKLDDDGTIVTNIYFMEFGYEKMGLDPIIAEWMMLPAQIAMAFGFILPTAKLFQAMSCSKLIPQELGGTKINVAFCYTLPISFALCLCGFYIPNFNIENIPIFFAMFTYLSDLFAYCKMQTEFTSMEREFRSPFGIVGSVFAGLVFILCAISIAAFQTDFLVLEFAAVFWVLLSVYYFAYAKNRQIFSDEEQKTLLTLHVISLNRRKRLQKKKTFLSKLSSTTSATSAISRDKIQRQ